MHFEATCCFDAPCCGVLSAVIIIIALHQCLRCDYDDAGELQCDEDDHHHRYCHWTGVEEAQDKDRGGGEDKENEGES